MRIKLKYVFYRDGIRSVGKMVMSQNASELAELLLDLQEQVVISVSASDLVPVYVPLSNVKSVEVVDKWNESSLSQGTKTPAQPLWSPTEEPPSSISSSKSDEAARVIVKQRKPL